MARYIDADKFKSHLEGAMKKMHLIGGVKAVDVGAVIKVLDMQPTADVAPKSEVDRWRRNLEAVLEERAETKQEIAMEIFEDLESMIYEHGVINCHKLDKLKKKYTEE